MSGWVLVLGPTSAIARATAAELACAGYDLYLAGRDDEELGRLAADLHLRHGVQVAQGRFDALDMEAHPAVLDEALAHCGALEGVVLAFGERGDQQRARRDPAYAAELIASNFTGAVSMLTLCANHLEPRGRGFMIVLGSVAGDRGRQSNYVYGAAKGGLGLFAQGLRNRLHGSGVRVLTVKPGFVDTAMTFGLSGMFLVASPESVGRRIVAALGRSTDVLYVPWFWRYIMVVIRLLPERLFKRLNL